MLTNAVTSEAVVVALSIVGPAAGGRRKGVASLVVDECAVLLAGHTLTI